MSINLIEVNNLSKTFINSKGQELSALKNLNFSLAQGEIVAILGKSGSGKSTLLRIIAGLVQPSDGSILYRGKPLLDPVPGITMVFQSFALMPWLTVLQNVELGLEAQGVERVIRRQRALKTIDTVGLDGFESAYPKELSGGMRQRVGLARALVVEPEILLMDEAFSALDILTTDSLRNDLLNLWHSQATMLKSIICVTHDIEEALIMANRVIIFASNPGRIHTQIKINLPYPRDTDSPEFKKLLSLIYTQMTISERSKISARLSVMTSFDTAKTENNYAYRVPEVDISELTGLVDSMEDHEVDGKILLSELAENLHLEVNQLFSLTELLDVMRFIKIESGEISFTAAGKNFAAADILLRKQIFATHLISYIPLAQYIRNILEENAPSHKVHENVFLDAIRSHFSEEEAVRVLRTIIDLGRYAEIFAYNYDSGELSLENPQ